MKRAKGLDDLILIEGQPRLRAYHRAPPGLGSRRVPERSGGAAPARDGRSLDDVRATTASAIHGFVGAAGEHRGQALLVATPPGAGKSHALREAVATMDGRVRVVAGTKQLAAEIAAASGWMLIHGRNRENCERFDVVQALAEGGHDIGRLACGSDEQPRCPFRDHCSYLAQFDGDGHRVGTTEQLYNPAFLSGGDLLVVDDGDLARAMVRRHRIPRDVLDRSLDRLRRKALRDVVAFLLWAIYDAPEPALYGVEAWDHLATVAARHGVDLEATVAAIPEGFEADPRAGNGGPVLSAGDVEDAEPGSLSWVFALLRAELPRFLSGDEFNSGLRIGRRAVEAGMLKSHVRDREGRPYVEQMALLVLDATAVEPLVDHLLQGHLRRPDVREQIRIPESVRVVQYATSGNGHTVLADEANLERVVRQVQKVREQRPVSAPEREALVTYRKQRDAFIATGMLREKVLTFGGLRGSNAVQDVERLHLVGRPMPPPDEVLYLANIIHSDEPMVSRKRELRRRPYAGQAWEMTYLDFADPRASLLLRASRDDEIEQAIHRARLYLAGPARPVELVVYTNYPLDGVRVDELVVGSAPAVNDTRHDEAAMRIWKAITEIVAEGAELSDTRIAKRAKADPRTVRKALRKRMEREQDTAIALGTTVETAPLVAGVEALGNEMETLKRDPLEGLHDVPQRSGTSLWDGVPPGSRADRPHWDPCPGGCGWYIPPGQRCFDCASAAVAAWVTQRVHR